MNFQPLCKFRTSNCKLQFTFNFNPRKVNWPEQQTENREGADVDAAAGDGREDASDEAGHNQDDRFPRAENRDGVVSLSFLFT